MPDPALNTLHTEIPTQNSQSINYDTIWWKKKKVYTKCYINTNGEAILLGEEDIKMFPKEVMYKLPERKLGTFK